MGQQTIALQEASVPFYLADFQFAETPLVAATSGAATGASSALPKNLDGPSTILIGVGVVVLIYLMVLRPMFARNKTKKRDPLATQPMQRTSLAAERQAERQMHSLVVELEKMTRELGAQLDTKTARLEALLQEADSKTAELRRLMGQQKGEAMTTGKSLGLSIDQAPRRPDSGEKPQSIGDKSAEGGLAPLDKHKAIYSLADEGKTVGDIARELDRPAGEVELILALRG